ncbi:hypothetical protein CEXT_332471 [Caerostris extrusa]|uniref:Uncharacterized protein n=1 Tax=Caerostris extrusa TaxID=172846 RepID=A0AAV4QT21_CAEEX|nr:hypothetical protein CEXT_332471 [Caerostris extrusa]
MTPPQIESFRQTTYFRLRLQKSNQLQPLPYTAHPKEPTPCGGQQLLESIFGLLLRCVGKDGKDLQFAFSLRERWKRMVSQSGLDCSRI